MVEERERKPNYNPADYAQLKVEANAIDKKELEDFYVLTKDKKYTRCGEKWGIFFGVVFMLAILIGIGFAIAEAVIESKVSDNLVEVSAEICPILGEGYISGTIIKSDYGWDKIMCNEINSGSKNNPEISNLE